MTTLTPKEFWHIVPSPDDSEPITNHRKLPSKLWHVQHDQSRSFNRADGGFQARNPTLDIRTRDALVDAAAKHFLWRTRGWESCFISTFANDAHAISWAERMRSLGKKRVVIYELNTAKLPPRTMVLKAKPLCKKFSIHHPWMKHEWLFHQRIPAGCITVKDCPGYNYTRSFEPMVYSTALDDVLVGCEWLPPSSTGGPRPPSPAQTEEDQDGLDELTGRMNGLGLQNDSGTLAASTPDADGSPRETEDFNPEPTDNALIDSTLAPEEEVDADLTLIDSPAVNVPVKHETTDSGSHTDDIPKTSDAETQTDQLIDPLPTVDTANTEDSAEQSVTYTQLSGETIVNADSIQEEEATVDLIPQAQDESPEALAYLGGTGPIQAMQEKIIWQVNK